MPYINGMLVQSDGSRPHVVYIMRVLAETFPNVIWKIGGRVNRRTAGGGLTMAQRNKILLKNMGMEGADL